MKQSGRFPCFRERLNDLMKNEQMSTTEFAEKLGLSRQTVGFYLNGDRIPDALTLRQICERCSVSADYLLGLSDAKSQNIEIQAVCSYLGLSEDAVASLHTDNYDITHSNAELNPFFESDDFHRLKWFICEMCQTQLPLKKGSSHIVTPEEYQLLWHADHYYFQAVKLFMQMLDSLKLNAALSKASEIEERNRDKSVMQQHLQGKNKKKATGGNR